MFVFCVLKYQLQLSKVSKTEKHAPNNVKQLHVSSIVNVLGYVTYGLIEESRSFSFNSD